MPFSGFKLLPVGGLCAVDGEYILGLLNRRLLELGMGAADCEKDAGLIVCPSVAHAAIDDTSLLIGLPAIPLVLPGAGGVTFPEAALLKHTASVAATGCSWWARTPTKRLAFATATVSSQTYYERWVILFVFNFRSTDLIETH